MISSRHVIHVRDHMSLLDEQRLVNKYGMCFDSVT